MFSYKDNYLSHMHKAINWPIHGYNLCSMASHCAMCTDLWQEIVTHNVLLWDLGQAASIISSAVPSNVCRIHTMHDGNESLMKFEQRNYWLHGARNTPHLFNCHLINQKSDSFGPPYSIKMSDAYMTWHWTHWALYIMNSYKCIMQSTCTVCCCCIIPKSYGHQSTLWLLPAIWDHEADTLALDGVNARPPPHLSHFCESRKGE